MVNELADLCDMAEWVDNLTLQLQELELLRAMFPGEGELVMDNIASQSDLQMWLDGSDHSSPPPSLAFVLRIPVRETMTVAASVVWPPAYPSKRAPGAYLRVQDWSIPAQSRANAALQSYLSSLDLGELMMGNIVQWIQDELPAESKSDPKPAPSSVPLPPVVEPFIRYWIYSHHIYSQTKRRDILKLGHEFQLTGFSMPGKPGIVCLEGWKSDCESAWSVIKSWNWQKIQIKLSEEVTVPNHSAGESQRCFRGFQEIGEVKQGNTNYRMDMTEFRNFLTRHNQGDRFGELFGVAKAE